MYSSSCTKDACKGVTCLHKGMCGGGSCICIDSGIGGQNCEIIYRELYKNTYLGNTVISYGSLDSPVVDTGYVNYTAGNNTLKFSVVNDTAFSQMQLVWNDAGGSQILQTDITLANNGPTGSTFKVLATQGSGLWNSYSFQGSGSVNGTNATLNLTATTSDTTKPAMTFTLSNFSKQ